VLGNEELLIESEVLGGSLYEVVASSDDFAVEGVDAKINVAVTAADTSGQFLALDGR
jgi:hypothetical protein